MKLKSLIFLGIIALSIVTAEKDLEHGYSKGITQCPNGNCISFHDSDSGSTIVETELQNTLDQRKRWRRSSQERSTCELPPRPQYGSFEVIGDPYVPGESHFLRLNVTCDLGYSLVGKSLIICIEGTWYEEMPKCVRSCRLDKDPSVNYKCVLIDSDKLGTSYRECNDYEPIGVVVKPECNAPNYYHTGVLSRMTCTETGWNNIALCMAECGRITAVGEDLIIGGKAAKRGEFPWHAGIYRKISTPYEQICGGSLVSSSVVISAAHCFWDKYRNTKKPASDYAVAVGKLYRPWNDTHDYDADAQKSDVSDKDPFQFVQDIIIPSGFRGSETNFQQDIAVLVLTTPIKYQTHVRPVCLDLVIPFEKQQLKAGNMGKVAGWGFTDVRGTASPVLKVASLPFVTWDQCYAEAPEGFREYLTSDKICAGTKTGTALCKGDSGGGLVFPEWDRGTQRYYLRGIVSTAPSNEDACNAFAYTSFTQLTSLKTFLEDNIVLFGDNALSGRTTQAALCFLPPYPDHGGYVVSGTPNIYPGQAFLAVQINITCDYGYAVDGDSTMSCSNGLWSKYGQRCVRMCEIHEKSSLEFRCYDVEKDTYRECNYLEPSGTIIDVSCSSSYYSIDDSLPRMTCIEGSWTKGKDTCTNINLDTCKPECGIVSTTRQQSNEGLFPWYALIYLKQNDTEDPSYVCGGTLIRDKFVISAAHCFWSGGGPSHPETDYVVAVGKTHIAWNDSRDPGAQTSDVRKLEIPNRFQGSVTNYQNDIVMIVLKTPFENTEYVTPVCLDFNIDLDQSQLQSGKIGKVATWQYGDKEGNKGELETLAMSYVAIDECIKESEDSFKPFITSDKICARRTNGTTGLCKWDSGSGLVFPEKYGGVERYYLRGVTSVSPYSEDDETCSRIIPMGFTQIQPHERFINDNLERFTYSYSGGGGGGGRIGTTGLCKWDSGSGLVFPETYGGVERYYLRGVTSVSPYSEDDETCSRIIPMGFTQIQPHERFINDNLERFTYSYSGGGGGGGGLPSVLLASLIG